MLACDACRDNLLDHIYGLLSPTESSELEAHLSACPACAAARVKAAQAQGLIARAAMPAKAGVMFAPPTSPSVPQKPAATVAPSRNGSPVSPVEPGRSTVRGVWVRWAVAAGVLLAITGLGGPAARDLAGFAYYKPPVDRDLAAVSRAESQRDELREKFARARVDAELRLANAKKDHDELVAAWVKAEDYAANVATNQPFFIDITGPSSAIPGAPNKYVLNVTPNNLKPGANNYRGAAPVSATVKAEVRDGAGTVVLSEEFDAAKKPLGLELYLTPAVWAKVKPGSDLSMHVSAIDPRTGANTSFSETIRLQKPQFTTYLTTDKPMYRPGESVRFRSLTLDRTRFLPPDREMVLAYILTGPSGGQIASGYGLAKPVTEYADGSVNPVRGPDGKPLRGVGAGEFELPQHLDGGEYTLVVREQPQPGEADPNHGKPIATRKFVVDKYTPHVLLKTIEFGGRSYGPGDEVTAKIEVSHQAQKLAGAKLTVTARADNDALKVTAPAETDANGTAIVRFKLPVRDEIVSASVSFDVNTPVANETVSRPIPLATRKLNVDFFPEGGTLVEGIPGRVYFRATTTVGKPADIEGTLTDGVKDIGTIKTLTDEQHPGVNQGLGSFEFTPEAGKHYFVKLSKPLGIVQPLIPAAASQQALAGFAGTAARGYAVTPAANKGVVLTALDAVTKPGDPIRIRLAVGGKDARNLLVGAYVRGQSVAHAKVKVEPGKSAEVALDSGKVQTGGVTRVTVFDDGEDLNGVRQDLTPVAERLVYRQPGEVLNLKYDTRKLDGTAKVGAYIPGEGAKLDITATTEKGTPAPAILWTAVVNKSVITMADEKTARLLPTHFLLAGETEKPNDLEHSDFLLTSHPKAAPALDLLLGSQGWRRFVEQGGTFYRKDDARAEELMVAYGAGPVPSTWRAGVRKVFDEYWPKYESALLNLENAEDDNFSLASTGNLTTDLENAEKAYDEKLHKFGASAAGLQMFDDGMAERKNWLPAAAFGLVAVGLLLLAARFTRPVDAAERKPLTAGALSLFVLTGFLMIAVGVTQSGNGQWRAVAAVAPKPQSDRSYAYGPIPTAAVGVAEPDAGNDPELQLELGDAQKAQNVDVAAPTGAAAPKPGSGMAGGKRQPDRKVMEEAGEAKKAKGAPQNDWAANARALDELRYAPGRGQGGFGGMTARPGVVPPPGAMMPMAPGKHMPADGFVEAEKLGGDKKDGALAFLPGQFKQGNALRVRERGDGKLRQEQLKKAEDARRNGFDEKARREDRDMGRLAAVPVEAADRLKGTVYQMAMQQKAEKAKETDKQYAADPNAKGDITGGGGGKPGEGGPGLAAGLVEKQQREAENYALKAWNLIQRGMPKAPPLVIRQYAHAPRPDTNGKEDRTDFTETVQWHPALVTGADGKASVSFAFSDAINPYEVLVAGHTLDGRIGAVKGTIEVRKPFAVDFRLPQEVGSNDKIDLPLGITNATDTALSADIKALATGFKVDVKDIVANLNATTDGRKFVRLTPDMLKGSASVKFAGTTTRGLSDTISRTTTIVTEGFPAEGSEGATLEQVGRVTLKVPELRVPNTLTATVTVFPSTLSELQSGLDGLLREPRGCFEQSSTSNYPNVLISEYMRDNKLANPDITRRADNLMDQGYRKLIGFECRKPTHGQEGYEWFGGKAPPHEALTAYGLLQFTDMSRVYKVDPEMLKRTKSYLLEARDGKGGFKRNARAIDTFGGAPIHLTNAYIVWAITESELKGEKSDLSKELDANLELAKGTGPAAKDPYFLSLTAISALNADRRKDGIALLEKVAGMQKPEGNIPGAETSITRSYGRDLEIETTALAVLGWTKANRHDLFLKPSQSAMKWIGKQRNAGGSFGSTQSTILALKALIENAKANRRPAEAGSVTVYVNDVKVGEKKFTTETVDPIAVEIPDAEKTFAKGTAEVRVECSGKNAYPYTVAWACRNRQPVASDKCDVRLTTAIDRKEVTEGETLRLNVSVQNLKKTDHGMVTAIVGLPAGVRLPENMEQLKRLTERPVDGSEPVLSYWETRGRELILYWRAMKPEQKIDLTLDVIAETPGEYYGPASRAYVYYNAEHKHWVTPIDVKIKAKSQPEATAAK